MVAAPAATPLMVKLSVPAPQHVNPYAVTATCDTIIPGGTMSANEQPVDVEVVSCWYKPPLHPMHPDETFQQVRMARRQFEPDVGLAVGDSDGVCGGSAVGDNAGVAVTVAVGDGGAL